MEEKKLDEIAEKVSEIFETSSYMRPYSCRNDLIIDLKRIVSLAQDALKLCDEIEAQNETE